MTNPRGLTREEQATLTAGPVAGFCEDCRAPMYMTSDGHIRQSCRCGHDRSLHTYAGADHRDLVELANAIDPDLI